MEHTAPLLFERDGDVARLVLNRPAAANALDLSLGRALASAATECDEDESIRCVVLTGSGKLFCAGGDIASFVEKGEHVAAFIKDLTAALHLSMSRFARMSKPFVTSINGPAAGAGLSLAALGDVALATRSAHFTLAYTAIGLSPDGGSTWLLPRLIGLRRTQELALLNRRLSADEAAEIGLITRVVDDGMLEAETATLAHALASSATAAIGRTRALLLSSFVTSFETQMEFESRAIADGSRTADYREGVAAFLGKRKPNFTR